MTPPAGKPNGGNKPHATVTGNNTGFNKMLEQLRQRADGDGHTKGKLFEKVVKSFLSVDPIYKDRFESVWLWDEYPERNKSHDIGADLVAKEKSDGSLCAIQCKFYDKTTIQKKHIDSFLEAGSRSTFSHMMLVYTGSSYGKNVEDALKGHGCTALNFKSLSTSNVNWPDLAAGLTKITRRDPYKLRDYQKKALVDVSSGLAETDRGKLIMACGTGKTLVSLRIAESMVGVGGLVLYAVPSISLMHQSIRYWSEQKTIPHGYVGVCSDPKVSHGDEAADIPIIEMEIRVTTNPKRIASALKKTDKKKMTVVFSTYQSMKAVVDAQKEVGRPFDLVLCDEAHRTTGADKGNEWGAQLVHTSIDANKRIYMTATPKIFQAKIKTKTSNLGIPLYSMDDTAVYGKTLHELSFSDAIDAKQLSDYKVAVLAIDERYGAKYLQNLVDVTTEAGDLKLTDAARMLGLYKALQNPDSDNEDMRAMQTCIVYTNRVVDSKTFARTFDKLTRETDGKRFSCDSRHVDGTQNATERADAIQWLRESSSVAPDECRILSNARCLSEGVDVPALDSIAFMNPKESMVEIVQAVGRVMRKSEKKSTGYVILPIGVPPNQDANQILDNNKVFETVWKILQALRSHDERMSIECNTADLRKELPKRVSIFGVDRDGRIRQHDPSGDTIPIGELDVPSNLIYSKIVDEVGDRRYFEYWSKDVADVVARLQERILTVIGDGKKSSSGGSGARKMFDSYMSGLREIMSDSVTEQDGIDMLAQHMVTRRIFNAIFDTDEFAKKNPVSVTLDAIIDELFLHGLDVEMDKLESFYKSIENRVSKLDTHDARQPVISELYGTFFKQAFPKMSERLGIVYTPQEVVDFILRSVDHVSRENFGRGVTDKNVNIIDPFTGAGTFLTRLMSEDLGMIRKEDLVYKYHNELFANEIVLLAYYIALVNCESVYAQRAGKFEQFEGISLTDTFSPGKLDEHTGDIMANVKRRIRRQRQTNITVIVGNPPYSAGQSNYNDQNQNIQYDDMDKRIKDTYLKKTKIINTNATHVGLLYDSYIRSIRWASDRIGKSGIIGFVTNASFIRTDVAAGIRACLQQEFTDVWIFDLRGNQRTRDEISRKEGGKIFGSGSRAPVAIIILVKNPKKTTPGTIYYRDIGDYHDRETKLNTIKTIGSIKSLDWKIIKPDKHHDWLGQRSSKFSEYLPIGSKDAKKGKGNAVFKMYSGGVTTGRDAWIYNSSKDELVKNMERHISYCNSQNLDNPITNPKKAKWDRESLIRLKRLGMQKFSKNKIRISLYRPFFKQNMYFDNVFNAMQALILNFFPKNDSKNSLIVCGFRPDMKIFGTYIVDSVPDLNIMSPSPTQCFPLYTYYNNSRQDNITDYTQEEYCEHYGDKTISKEDIFYYVYGLLHHPDYRKKYANNLSRELPHIPMAPDFWAFSKTGKQLADLHLFWETCKRYKLGKPKAPFGKYEKMAFDTKKASDVKGKKQTDGFITLKINGIVVFDNIPKIDYKVNGRTPLAWAVDRYKVRTDKDSDIINDATKTLDGKDIDIIALIERLVYVGVESDRLIANLPKEFEPKNWKPAKTGLEKFSTEQTKK